MRPVYLFSYFQDRNTRILYFLINIHIYCISYPGRHLHGCGRSGLQLGSMIHRTAGTVSGKARQQMGFISRSAPCSDWLIRAEAWRLARVRLRRITSLNLCRAKTVTWQIDKSGDDAGDARSAVAVLCRRRGPTDAHRQPGHVRAHLTALLSLFIDDQCAEPADTGNETLSMHLNWLSFHNWNKKIEIICTIFTTTCHFYSHDFIKHPLLFW